MSGADLFEDGYPHGTVEGHDGGCRGGSCPGALEYGLSCKQAKILHASDIRYDRLVAAGKTPTEISDIINGRTPATSPEEPTMTTTPAPKPAPPKTTQSAAQPLAERAHDTEPQEDAGTPTIETDAPAEGTPVAEAEAMGHPTGFETFDKSKTPAGPSQSAVREWARANSIHVNQRGTIRKDVTDAYLAAHPALPTPEFTEALEQTRERITDEDVAAAAIADQRHHEEVADMFTDEIWGTTVQDLVATAVNELGLALELPEYVTNNHPVDPIRYENLPRPEWAEVAISEDVERARRIAIALEQELGHTAELLAIAIQERDTAQAALDLTLHKWSKERVDRGAAEISHLITAEQLHQAHHFIDDLGIANLALIRVIEAHAQQPTRRAPWWSRRR